MTELYRITIVSCVCMSMLLFSACKKKPDEPETSLIMTGMLTHNIPPYIHLSRMYTFTLSGITEPEEGLNYRWEASGFAPGSCDTQSYICLSPDVKGSYTITASVSCEGYYEKALSHTVIVIDTLFFPSLSGIIRGTDSIADPRDGNLYYTRVYGDLEWFVQNLNWAGAGNPYGKIDALATPFGRLYSWNEATSGMAGGKTPGIAAEGLGKGPQGVCPPGWSVPTNDDWAHLATVVNKGTPLSFFDSWDNIADPLCAYAKLNDENLWPYSPRNTKSNTTAWNGLPAGNSANNGNNYGNSSQYGFWLSSSEANANNGYYRYINYDINQVPYHNTDKGSFGASVRCVRLVKNQ